MKPLVITHQCRSARYKRAVDASDLAHIGLDILGIVPGPGELADLTNVGLYAAEGEWFWAVISVISMLPGFGDAIAKPIKWAMQAGKKIPVQILKTVKQNAGLIVAAIKKLANHPKYGEYVSNLLETLAVWLASPVFTAVGL